MSTTLIEQHVAAPTRWAVDADATSVEFAVKTFWGLATVHGRFDRFDGWYLGAGLDWVVAPNWILGLEYRHYDFDATNSIPLDVGLTVWSDGRGHYASTTQFPWLGADARSEGPPGYPVFVSIEGAAIKQG